MTSTALLWVLVMETLTLGGAAGAAGPGAHSKPKSAAEGAMVWLTVNSLFIGDQRLSNQRSFPGQLPTAGYTVRFGKSWSVTQVGLLFSVRQGPYGIMPG